VEIRALSESDDRSAFRSGDHDLDGFFLRFAGQNQFRHHLGVTYVAIEGRRILGFVTVAAGSAAVDLLPPSHRKRLPRYPVPVLRIARLAVDERAQGKNVGATLLRFALALAVRMKNEVGCIGAVVDAKPRAVEFYERYGFERITVLEGMSEARPLPTPMFLSVAEIENAAK
jgi:ribosomal protein S18 acetylase RimI-like enzyme